MKESLPRSETRIKAVTTVEQADDRGPWQATFFPDFGDELIDAVVEVNSTAAALLAIAPTDDFFDHTLTRHASAMRGLRSAAMDFRMASGPPESRDVCRHAARLDRQLGEIYATELHAFDCCALDDEKAKAAFAAAEEAIRWAHRLTANIRMISRQIVEERTPECKAYLADLHARSPNSNGRIDLSASDEVAS